MDRRYFEELERQTLSKFAVLSSQTKGREHPISSCDIRTEFQRDRDRILHCKSFRRLKYKTQVFLSPEGDHYRTRLTHTLEVSQIARTISRALRLNEDLTEAIALGHDLGHTPFGHVGERVLNDIPGIRFLHNEQSLKVVEKLENGVGLNLTYEVRDGILNHRKNDTPSTLEGKVVSFADRIAYINHDIDDALRGGIIRAEDMPKDCISVLGDSHGKRINTMILDILKSSELPAIRMSDEVAQATDALRQYMFDQVYLDSFAKQEEKKAVYILNMLYDYFMKHQDEVDENCLKVNESLQRAVVDYIAGMTDRFAVNTFTNLFVPKPWKN